MSLTLGFAKYLVLWWLTLFMVLLWGAQHTGTHELKSVDDPDAPSKPKLLIKCTLTTLISEVFFAIVYLVAEAGWISFQQLH